MGIWPLRGKMFGRALRAHPRRADACCSSVPNTASGPSSRQVSALLGKRTTPDSPALHPLHSSRSSPAFRRNGIGSMPGLRSFVPPAANCRDRQNSSCAPEEERLQRARGFAYCPGNSIMARCTACRPGPTRTSNSREHGQLSLRLASRNCPASLVRPIQSDTSPPGCVRCCRSRPCTHRVAALALRLASRSQITTHSRFRDSPDERRGRLRTIRSGYDARSCASVPSRFVRRLPPW